MHRRVQEHRRVPCMAKQLRGLGLRPCPVRPPRGSAACGETAAPTGSARAWQQHHRDHAAVAAAAAVPPWLQGSAFYLSGAALVIVGWTVIGLCVEAYGFWLLFCEFIPTVLQFSRRVPFLSKALDLPFFKAVRRAVGSCKAALQMLRQARPGGAGQALCCQCHIM